MTMGNEVLREGNLGDGEGSPCLREASRALSIASIAGREGWRALLTASRALGECNVSLSEG